MANIVFYLSAEAVQLLNRSNVCYFVFSVDKRVCLCVLLFVGCHRSTRLFDQSNVQINPIVMALHKSLFCFKFQRSLLLITTAHTFVIDYARKRSISFPSLRLSVYLIRWNVYVEVVQICLSLVAFIAFTCLVTQSHR